MSLKSSKACGPDDEMGTCPLTLKTIGDFKGDIKQIFTVCNDPTFYDVDALYTYITRLTNERKPLIYPHNKTAISESDLDRLKRMYKALQRLPEGKEISSEIRDSIMNVNERNRLETKLSISSISPDLSKIAFTLSQGRTPLNIWKIGDQSSQEIELQLQNITSIIWSPDGSKILLIGYTYQRGYQKKENYIYIVDVNTETLIHKNRTLDIVDEFKWSPDGTHIAFTSGVFETTSNGGRLFVNNRINIFNVSSRYFEHSTTFDNMSIDHLTWSPDSRQIGVGLKTRRVVKLCIWTIEPDNKQYYDITNQQDENIISMAWKPIGTEIAIGTNNRLFIFNSMNGEIINTLIEGTNYEFPVWSPVNNNQSYLLVVQSIDVLDEDKCKLIIWKSDYSDYRYLILDNIELLTIRWSNQGLNIGFIKYQDNVMSLHTFSMNTLFGIAGGTKQKYTYKGRRYVIRIGTRGGRYILVGANKKKIYI